MKDPVKRLFHGPIFYLDCGFLVSDVVPLKISYSRMIEVFSEYEIFNQFNDTVIQLAMGERFLEDEYVEIDASHFESYDDPHPTEKKKSSAQKKHGRISKEN